MKHTSHILSAVTLLLVLAATIPAGIAQKRELRAQTHASHGVRPNAAGTVFGAAQSYSAGAGISQSVVADLNGDGIPDLAVVSCNASSCGSDAASVAVLIGNGDGSLRAPVMYSTGSFNPMSVAVGDLNGDGIPDLVVASQCASSVNCGTGQVSVLLGNGDGTFQSPVPYSTGTGSSYFVVIGDFNGDGSPDLAVANQTSQTANSTIAILLGNGDGTFQAPVSYSTGAPSAVFLAAADFNGDGALDLAVANSGTQDSVSILLGNGNGSFQTAAIYGSGGAFVNALAVADFNGDGAPDLAVINGCASDSNLTCSGSGAVGVLLGNGDGTFQAPVSYGSGGNYANSVAIADFNGDGIPDLAVGNYGPSAGGSSAGVLSLLLGNGDGTFQPAATFGTGGDFTASVAAGDFNQDGQPDVAVINQCSSSGNCVNGVAGVALNTASGFNRYASSTSLTSSVNPAAANQAVLLTATVTPAFNNGAPTGNMTFYNGAAALATVALSSGQAAYTAAFASPGPQALQAVYSGNNNYAASSSAVVSEIVGTPVTLTSSLNPAPFNQSATFTATVAGTGGTPTGTVTFMDGTTSLGTIRLANGTAAVTKSLTAGTHSITATYNGDSNFAPGFAALTEAVSQASTTALVSSANPASPNEPITYTATVTGQYGGVVTGTVAFMQGTSPVTWGTATLVNGVAILSNTFNKANTYAITAVYLGGPSYQGSTSAALNQVVSGNQSVSTTTGLVSSGSPSIVNQPVTFTATVTPASGAIPNGETVTFYNGTNTLGTGTTANGVAVLTTSSLPVATNSITATYAGDATYQGSTSKVVKQVVQLGPTNTTLSSSANPSIYGQPVTFSVAVAPQSGPGTPTGTVLLKNGGTVINSITLSNGTGSYTTSTLGAGSYSMTASYTGDASFANSTSATVTQTVNTSSTVTTLTSSPNPSSVNQTVTLTATVTGQYSGRLGGTVTFTQGAKTLGDALPAAGTGKASITYSFTATGTYPVIATYSGDTNNTGSASAALNQVVGNIATTTTVTSSGSPAYAGQAITFTAGVTPTSGAIPDGETVTFYDGSAAIGTGTTKGGVASLVISTLAVGTHSITATYAGDSTYQASTSRVLRQVVSLNVSVTTLVSSANPSIYGQPVILTATVAAGSGSATPTGKVLFKNGATVMQSVGLVNGVASYTPASLATGSLPLEASYTGDANFAASNGSLTQTVNQLTTTTTLTSTPNPSSLSQTVTFTATVTAQYSGTITGAVSFLNGSKTLGSATPTRGKATFTYAFPAAGTDSITAVYAGDANNHTSTSPAVSQVVTTAPTTTTVTSSALTAPVGQPVTFTATVTSAYGSIPDGELVTFYDSSTEIGTGNTKAGAAAMTTSSLTSGTHEITATYAGDSSFATSTSRDFRQTISQATTTTLLTTSANPATYGLPITFSVMVTSTGSTPTGTVTFKNGVTVLGVATLNPQGAATLTTLNLGAGAYSITAAYSGDASSAKSTSATLNQVVNQAATSTQIVSSVNPAALGESVTFTAIVRSATTFATGSVTFSAGSASLGTATLVNGTAKLAVTTLPAGATTVTATYAGSANVAGSSGSIMQNVE